MKKARFFTETLAKTETSSGKEVLSEKGKLFHSKHEQLVKHLWKMDARMLQSNDVQEKDSWAEIRLKLSKTIEDMEKKLSTLKEHITSSSLDNSEHSSKSNGSFKA